MTDRESHVIPDRFKDDGCTDWLDGWFGYNCRPCCRHHDWESCTRAHPAGSMTEARKIRRALELQRCVTRVLPWYLDWTVGIAIRVVAAWPGYWDSCGPEAGALCRHNLPMPDWMQAISDGDEDHF